jgi:hypothetical protein
LFWAAAFSIESLYPVEDHAHLGDERCLRGVARSEADRSLSAEGHVPCITRPGLPVVHGHLKRLVRSADGSIENSAKRSPVALGRRPRNDGREGCNGQNREASRTHDEQSK